MSETEATPLDVQELRRGLRDVAALTALPIAWAESDARHIAESLAAALLEMLRLEFVKLLLEAFLEFARRFVGFRPRALILGQRSAHHRVALDLADVGDAVVEVGGDLLEGARRPVRVLQHAVVECDLHDQGIAAGVDAQELSDVFAGGQGFGAGRLRFGSRLVGVRHDYLGVSTT